jgi:hypothetical protein
MAQNFGDAKAAVQQVIAIVRQLHELFREHGGKPLLSIDTGSYEMGGTRYADVGTFAHSLRSKVRGAIHRALDCEWPTRVQTAEREGAMNELLRVSDAMVELGHGWSEQKYAAAIKSVSALLSRRSRAKPREDSRRSIVLVNGRTYRIRSKSQCVTDREDCVLRAFLENGGALDQPRLIEKSGVGDAPRVLKRLCRRYGGIFKPAIRLPGGKKGAGGYHVNIRGSLPAGAAGSQ